MGEHQIFRPVGVLCNAFRPQHKSVTVMDFKVEPRYYRFTEHLYRSDNGVATEVCIRGCERRGTRDERKYYSSRITQIECTLKLETCSYRDVRRRHIRENECHEQLLLSVRKRFTSSCSSIEEEIFLQKTFTETYTKKEGHALESMLKKELPSASFLIWSICQTNSPLCFLSQPLSLLLAF